MQWQCQHPRWNFNQKGKREWERTVTDQKARLILAKKLRKIDNHFPPLTDSARHEHKYSFAGFAYKYGSSDFSFSYAANEAVERYYTIRIHYQVEELYFLFPVSLPWDASQQQHGRAARKQRILPIASRLSFMPWDSRVKTRPTVALVNGKRAISYVRKVFAFVWRWAHYVKKSFLPPDHAFKIYCCRKGPRKS